MNKGFSQNLHTDKQGDKPPFAVFLAATVIIFVLTLSAADSVGLVPDYIDGTADSNDRAVAVATDELPLKNLPQLSDDVVSEPERVRTTQPAAVTETTKPTHISIPAIGMSLSVQNPNTRDLATLDTLLQKGPARYVDSAELGEKGNVIIFAHSSRLPVVKNQMYKAFNRVSELTEGDTITLTGANGKKYLYSVISVKKVDANEASINLSPSIGTKLTLVTCDTLTSKSARFLLEADFIGAIDS